MEKKRHPPETDRAPNKRPHEVNVGQLKRVVTNILLDAEVRSGGYVGERAPLITAARGLRAATREREEELYVVTKFFRFLVRIMIPNLLVQKSRRRVLFFLGTAEMSKVNIEHVRFRI